MARLGAAGRVGVDDYSLVPVPARARYSWFGVAVQRFGQLSALAQFLLGATLGFGMSFWDAFWAFTLGAVVLEIVAILTGIAGMREGLSTSVLARWAGFGRWGSMVVALVTALSGIGWFGVQNGVFAEGLASLIQGVMPLWAWSVLTGLAITVIVIWGFLSMSWTAYVTVPLFLLLCAWSIGSALARHSLSGLVSMAPPGPHLSIAQGATLVAGGFIVGSVFTPDMTRFNRSVGDVIKQTVVGITLGEYAIGLIGVLLAHAARSGNVVTIVTSEVGLVGVLILVLGTLKINDWNLYSPSLAIVNLIDAGSGRRVDRALVTLVVGVLGTLLSALGILGHFVGFLTLLGVAFPPIGGILVVEYFLVRRHRATLDRARAAGRLPERAPRVNPVMAVSWIAGALVGQFVGAGIPAINSLVSAMVVYLVLSGIEMRVRGRTAAPRPEA